LASRPESSEDRLSALLWAVDQLRVTSTSEYLDGVAHGIEVTAYILGSTIVPWFADEEA
jgi:hypothetical protein